MKIRLLSLLLACGLVLGAMCPPALAVDSALNVEERSTVDLSTTQEDLTTTPEGVAFIKTQEGFTDTAYVDVSQMSIGYGCSTEYARKYGFSTTSITEEEADQLLIYVIAEMEQKLDAFLEENSISLNATQYDALVSFTFNVGTSWITSSSRLARLLISGSYSENEFASAMGVWCHVGQEIHSGLILRRIGEIKLFLYGAYALDDTENKFSYLIYDGNGGSVDVDIAFYRDGSTYEPLFSATHETEEFTGWFTSDGRRITEDTVVTEELTVFARWGENGEIPSSSDHQPVDDDLYGPVDPGEIGEGNEVTPEAPEVDLTEVFSDLQSSDWFYEYVQALYAQNVINGYTDGTFRPSKTVTTGEALKMILLAAGYEEPARVESHWARGYLNLALDEGIIARGDITDLDVPISRLMMAKVVANALGLTASGSGAFSDTSDSFVQALYEYGISEGYKDGTFRPGNSLTRAELSAIVWRILNI